MTRGIVRHVCVCSTEGTAKGAVPRAELRKEHGLEGDAHAGDGHRQISLLDATDIQTMQAQGLDLDPGAFGENLVVEGAELQSIGLGTLLRVGDAELEVTQIGKVCHTPGAIYHSVGDCIMTRAGIFARVVRGGQVAPGTSVEVTRLVSREVIQSAVITVSDRRAAGTAEDTAGPAVADTLERLLRSRVSWTGVVPDEAQIISDTIRDLADRSFDLLVTVGGTGCGRRDVTPEATRAVITREVPGLSEAMRAASAQITPHALLQRGVCGIRGSTLIVNLPGSRKAALENLTVILPALPHAVHLLRGTHGSAHDQDC